MDIVGRHAAALAPGKAAGLALARAAMSRYAASWHYEHGLFLGAAIRAGDAWDAALAGRALSFASSLVGEDGSIRGYAKDDFNLDMVNPGKNLFRLLGGESGGRFRSAIEALASQLRDQPKTRSGGFWHKLIYPDQMWLDGLYMAQPFAVEYGLSFGEGAWLDDAVRQFSLVADKARDPRNGLLRHAWDEARKQLWADPETGRSPCNWGRAMGWFAMALVDVLELFPAYHGGRATLEAILGSLAEAHEKFQDGETGLWHQIVDQGGRPGNYLEASASAMLAYSFMKGARLGFLDAARFVPAARRAYEGACDRFLRFGARGDVHLDGTCGVAGLGGSPYRDGSYEYYIGESVDTDDLKGIGPFILASIEYERSGAR